ncbi:MAG: hypothetical protein U9Q12_04525 [Patescibacteria group bacterium]|nr:hypothetical protein [Patescibacteria group bacterium]
MFDRIEKKVEEIRQKPENIRKRYVWFWVIAIMIIVIFIWVISMQITFFNMDSDTTTADETSDSLSTLQESLDSIDTDIIDSESVSIDELLEQSAETEL